MNIIDSRSLVQPAILVPKKPFSALNRKNTKPRRTSFLFPNLVLPDHQTFRGKAAGNWTPTKKKRIRYPSTNKSLVVLPLSFKSNTQSLLFSRYKKNKTIRKSRTKSFLFRRKESRFKKKNNLEALALGHKPYYGVGSRESKPINFTFKSWDNENGNKLPVSTLSVMTQFAAFSINFKHVKQFKIDFRYAFCLPKIYNNLNQITNGLGYRNSVENINIWATHKLIANREVVNKATTVKQYPTRIYTNTSPSYCGLLANNQILKLGIQKSRSLVLWGYAKKHSEKSLRLKKKLRIWGPYAMNQRLLRLTAILVNYNLSEKYRVRKYLRFFSYEIPQDFALGRLVRKTIPELPLALRGSFRSHWKSSEKRLLTSYSQHPNPTLDMHPLGRKANSMRPLSQNSYLYPTSIYRVKPKPLPKDDNAPVDTDAALPKNKIKQKLKKKPIKKRLSLARRYGRGNTRNELITRRLGALNSLTQRLLVNRLYKRSSRYWLRRLKFAKASIAKFKRERRRKRKPLKLKVRRARSLKVKKVHNSRKVKKLKSYRARILNKRKRMIRGKRKSRISVRKKRSFRFALRRRIHQKRYFSRKRRRFFIRVKRWIRRKTFKLTIRKKLRFTRRLERWKRRFSLRKKLRRKKPRRYYVPHRRRARRFLEVKPKKIYTALRSLAYITSLDTQLTANPKFVKVVDKLIEPTPHVRLGTWLKFWNTPTLLKYLLNLPKPLLLNISENSTKANLRNEAFRLQNQLTSHLFGPFNSNQTHSNLWVVPNSNITLRKKLLRSTATSVFKPILSLWYHHSLIGFIESCSGKKAVLHIGPFIENALTFEDKARINGWASRAVRFQRILGKKIFAREALMLVVLALKLKDPTFLASWIRAMLKRLSFWKSRLIFRYIKFLLRVTLQSSFNYLHLRGVKFRLKGKISVAGNARTRTLFYKVGDTSHSKMDNKVAYDLSFVGTFTGVQGFKLWFFY